MFNASRTVLFTILLSSTSLVGCDGNSKIKKMTDYELSERNSECVMNKPTAPGVATGCENIRKECNRRRKELKIYAC